MTVEYAIADKNKNILGYKADSFWTLVKNREHAKPHTLDEGWNIPLHILDNLQYVLGKTSSKNIITVLCNWSKDELLLLGEPVYVGWSAAGTDLWNWTHRIENEVVKPNEP